MKVTFLSVGWPGKDEVGGVARYAFRLAEEVAELVDLTVVTTEGGQPVPGARMIYLDRWSSRLGHYYRFPLQARKVLKDLDSDVIHAFGDDWALRSDGAPIVRTFLGTSLAEAKTSSGLRKLNHYVLAGLENVSKRRAVVRIGIGPESFAAFDCRYLMPPVRPVNVDADRLPTASPSVVFLGSWSGRKRGRLVYEAVEKARGVLQAEVSLSVIGPESDEVNWPSDVQHISGATDEQVQLIIQQSWVLMAPSSYEGFGIPTFEAMGFGVPVIGTANPGSRYLVESLGDEGAEAVDLVSDEELGTELVSRIKTGPWLSQPTQAHTRSVVSALIDQASAGHLVDEIYQDAIAHRSKISA